MPLHETLYIPLSEDTGGASFLRFARLGASSGLGRRQRKFYLSLLNIGWIAGVWFPFPPGSLIHLPFFSTRCPPSPEGLLFVERDVGVLDNQVRVFGSVEESCVGGECWELGTWAA